MKRFYKTVTVESAASHFSVCLDGRQVKTPNGTNLTLPSRALAEAVKAEWDAGGQDIEPGQMPCFSMAVTVIDRVMTQRQALCDELVRYAGNDVICYYAGSDDTELDARQKQSWDSWRGWAADRLGLFLSCTDALMPVSQPEGTAQAAGAVLAGLSDWQLGCVYRAVSLSGSFVLAMAFFYKEIDADRLFTFAFLDELYQNEKWGRDAEAVARQTAIRNELGEIQQFMALL